MNTDQLTFTRFIAAMSIVVFHFGDIYIPFNYSCLSPLVKHANLGVGYFFVLSGFVMVLAYGKKSHVSYRSYLRNRAVRILPLYYLAMLLMLLYLFIRLKILKIPHTYTPNVIDSLLNALMIQAWIPEKATTLNTAAWSLSVEALFYLSFPLIINQSKHIKTIYLSLLALSIFIISQTFTQLLVGFHHKHWFLYHPLLHLNSFFIGITAGIYYIRHTNNTGSPQIIKLTIIAFAILTLIYCPIKGLIYHNGLLSILFALFILFLATDRSKLSNLFKRPFFIHLGEISYGIYILQFPIFYFFTAGLSFLGLKINQPLFYIYLLLLIVFSDLSYRFVENPLRSSIRKK
ncbi:MAG: acyltransferase [Breznakibacter sp.]